MKENIETLKYQEKQLERLTILFSVMVILSFGLVTFILGFAIGTYNQESVMLNELKIRDFNLTNKLCIINPKTNELGYFLKENITKSDFKFVCSQNSSDSLCTM